MEHSAFSHIQALLTSAMAGGVLSIVLSAAVRALEPPDAKDGRFYRWFYRWTQLMLANFDKAKEGRQ